MFCCDRLVFYINSCDRCTVLAGPLLCGSSTVVFLDRRCTSSSNFYFATSVVFFIAWRRLSMQSKRFDPHLVTTLWDKQLLFNNIVITTMCERENKVYAVPGAKIILKIDERLMLKWLNLNLLSHKEGNMDELFNKMPIGKRKNWC